MLSLLLFACGSPTPVDFGYALAALEPVAIQLPVASGVLELQSGENVEDDWFFAHGAGWIDAPITEVWSAFREVDVLVDRREVDTYSMVVHPEITTFDYAFLIDNEVNDLLTVNYQLSWVHELQGGTVDAPERVVIRWDKTDGTLFIDLLSGSVELVDQGDGTTAVYLVEHLRAAARDEATIEAVLTDLFADVNAFAHGEALPTFE